MALQKPSELVSRELRGLELCFRKIKPATIRKVDWLGWAWALRGQHPGSMEAGVGEV